MDCHKFESDQDASGTVLAMPWNVCSASTDMLLWQDASEIETLDMVTNTHEAAEYEDDNDFFYEEVSFHAHTHAR